MVYGDRPHHRVRDRGQLQNPVRQFGRELIRPIGLDVDFDLPGANPGEYDAKDGISDVGGFLDNGSLQSCHPHNIPEILLLDEMLAAQVPSLRAGIPEIVGNRESPCVNLDLESGRTTCG